MSSTAAPVRDATGATDRWGQRVRSVIRSIWRWCATDTLRQIIAQGVPGTTMPAFSERFGGGLTDTQIDILIDGMQTQMGTPTGLHERDAASL